MAGGFISGLLSSSTRLRTINNKEYGTINRYVPVPGTVPIVGMNIVGTVPTAESSVSDPHVLCAVYFKTIPIQI